MKKLLLLCFSLLALAQLSFAQEDEPDTEGLDKKTIKLIKEKGYQEVQTKVTGNGTRHELVTVDHWAMYPKGLEGVELLFKNNIKQDKVKGLKGRVIVSFTVQADGTIDDIDIVEGLSNQADNEVSRVVGLMDKWVPARRDGEKVSLRYVQQIAFGEKNYLMASTE